MMMKNASLQFSRTTRLLALVVAFAMLCVGLVAGGSSAARAEGDLDFGTGVLKGTISLPAGVDATKYWIQLETLDGNQGFGGPTLNPNGSFEIAQLPSAEFRAVVRERDSNDKVLSAQVLEKSTGGTVFSTVDGQTKTQSFAMKPMTATISGTADVVGYPRLSVSVYQLIDGDWRHLSHAYDASGMNSVNYTSPKLAAGTYTMYFYADSKNGQPGGVNLPDCVLWWGDSPKTCWNTSDKQIAVAQGQAVTGINMTIPRTWTSRPDPVVPATAKVGKPVTATQTAFVPTPDQTTYQWYRTTPSEGWGLTPISGATSLTYTPTAADLGRELQLKTSATKLKYLDTASYSEFVGPVAAADLLDFTTSPVPTFEGTFNVGNKVTAKRGTWAPAAENYTYQWAKDGVAIAGATQESLTLAPGDLGAGMSVKVTGAKAGYNSKTVASATMKVAAGTMTAGTPTVSGTAAVGNKVSATAGTWAPAVDSYTYRWLRDGVAISGATSSTFTLAAADNGKKISVEVTGVKAGYTSAKKASPLVTVAAGSLTAGNSTVSGTAKVGSTLTAHAGTWVPTADQLSYQWLKDGEPISGATAENYTLTADDVGKQISVTMTGTKAGYTDKAVTSAAKTVESADLLSFASTPAPTISGTAKVGSTLTATAGVWRPSATKYAYEWYRDGKSVSGATKSTLELKDSDEGAQFSVEVTGSKAGYSTVSTTSAKTGKVAKVTKPSKPDYVAPMKTPFKDVKTSYKFYEPIAWMYTDGLSTGVKTGNGRDYQPKAGVSREAMAAFLYRLEGAKYTGPKVSPFSDVKPGDKFYNEIAWMYQEGLSTGVKTANGRDYQPKATVSREAMAAFIYRLEEATTKAPKASPFGDMNSGDKFYREISWMGAEGLSTGIKQSSGKPFYAPKAEVSREAMAAFLFRLETR